jgi:hypothetical protein
MIRAPERIIFSAQTGVGEQEACCTTNQELDGKTRLNRGFFQYFAKKAQKSSQNGLI